MTANTLVSLREKASDVAALLLSINDPDEREAAQELYETALNDELFHGAMNGAHVAGQSMILDAVFGDNNTHSLRIESSPDQVRRLAEYRAWKETAS